MTDKSSSVEDVNWQAQAYHYFVQDKYEQAASFYEQAITDEPENKSFYWHLGLLLLLQGQETEAWATAGHINYWSPESWEVFVKSICEEFEVETGLVQEGRRQKAEGRRKESFYSKLFNLFKLVGYFRRGVLDTHDHNFAIIKRRG